MVGPGRGMAGLQSRSAQTEEFLMSIKPQARIVRFGSAKRLTQGAPQGAREEIGQLRYQLG
jgi:hypothetical protein